MLDLQLVVAGVLLAGYGVRRLIKIDSERSTRKAVGVVEVEV